MMATSADLIEVVVKRHAAVHDHRTPAFASGALLQNPQHLVNGRSVLAISLEDLVGLGKALPVENQADHHLFAVRPLIARVAAPRLGIALALSFEVGRGQIVEVITVVQIEKRFLSLRQSRLDLAPVGV